MRDNAESPDDLESGELISQRGQTVENGGLVQQQVNVLGNASFSLGAGAVAAAGHTLGTVLAVGAGGVVLGVFVVLAALFLLAGIVVLWRESTEAERR